MSERRVSFALSPEARATRQAKDEKATQQRNKFVPATIALVRDIFREDGYIQSALAGLNTSQRTVMAEAVADYAAVELFGRTRREETRVIGRPFQVKDPLLDKYRGRLQRAGVLDPSEYVEMITTVAKQVEEAAFIDPHVG